MSDGGLIGQCEKYIAICGHKCCVFKDNYILLYPKEILPGEEDRGLGGVSHLDIYGEDGYGGARARCIRLCGEGDYKPLDCRSYPFFPVVKEGKVIGLLQGEKCPMIIFKEHIEEHALWVLQVWQDLVSKYPDIGRWLEEAELVGYARNTDIKPVHQLREGEYVFVGAYFGETFFSVDVEIFRQRAKMSIRKKAMAAKDHRLFREVCVDAPMATKRGVRVPVTIDGAQEEVGFAIAPKSGEGGSIWDVREYGVVEELAQLYAGVVYNVLANHSSVIRRTFEPPQSASTLLADWSFNEALNFGKEMDKLGWEMKTPTPWRTSAFAQLNAPVEFRFPLVPVSCGKESLTTCALLQEADYNWAAVIFNTESTRADRFWATESCMYKEKLLKVPTRVVTTNFAKVLYDRIPVEFGKISTFIPFIAIPSLIVALLDGHDAILLGNEYDCSLMADDPSTGRYWGANYDQSAVWCRKFSTYMETVVRRRIDVMSILDNLSETAIQWILRDLQPKWLKYQVSCDKPIEGVRNCGECIKCRRIAALLMSIGYAPETMGLKYDPTIFEESVDTVFSGAEGQVEFDFWREAITPSYTPIAQDALKHILGIVVDLVHPLSLPQSMLKIVQPILGEARRTFGG